MWLSPPFVQYPRPRPSDDVGGLVDGARKRTTLNVARPRPVYEHGGVTDDRNPHVGMRLEAECEDRNEDEKY